MERDPNILKLVREAGISRAPENLTRRVMDLIGEEPVKSAYQPIIGKWGRLVIVLFVVGIVTASVIYTEPGGKFIETGELFKGLNWQVPQIHFKMQFLSQFEISTGLVSALVALFILVLSDAGLRRKRMV